MNYRSRTFILTALIWLFLAPTAFSATVYPADYQQVFEQIEKQAGAILPRDENLALYQLVEELFKPLAEAQRRLLKRDDEIVLHDVFLFQSSEINAFVQVIHPRQKKKSHLVFISTAFFEKAFEIRKFVAASSEEERNRLLIQGVMRLIGVMAHELGHPIDILSQHSLKKEFGKLVAGQALELRAHIDAMLICQEAGYPSDSVHETLQMFKEVDDEKSAAQSENEKFLEKTQFIVGSSRAGKSQSQWKYLFETVDAGASSHPTHEVALAAIRGFLFWERYGLAMTPRESPKVSSTGRFVEKLSSQLRTRPKSLEEAQRFLADAIENFDSTPIVSETELIVGHVMGNASNNEKKIMDLTRMVHISILEWLLWLNRTPEQIDSSTGPLIKKVIEVLFASRAPMSGRREMNSTNFATQKAIVESLLISEPELFKDIHGETAAQMVSHTSLFNGAAVAATIVEKAKRRQDHYAEETLGWIHQPTVRALWLQRLLTNDLEKRTIDLQKSIVKSYTEFSEPTKDKIIRKYLLEVPLISLDPLNSSGILQEIDYEKILNLLMPQDLEVVESVVRQKLGEAHSRFLKQFSGPAQEVLVGMAMSQFIGRMRPLLDPLIKMNPLFINDVRPWRTDLWLRELFGFKSVPFDVAASVIKRDVLRLLEVAPDYLFHYYSDSKNRSVSVKSPGWVDQDFLNDAWLLIEEKRLPELVKQKWQAFLLNLDVQFYYRTLMAKLRAKLDQLDSNGNLKTGDDIAEVNLIKGEIASIARLEEDPVENSVGKDLKKSFDRALNLKAFTKVPIHFVFRALESSQLNPADKSRLIGAFFNDSQFLIGLNLLSQKFMGDTVRESAAIRQIYSIVTKHVPNASFVKLLAVSPNQKVNRTHNPYDRYTMYLDASGAVLESESLSYSARLKLVRMLSEAIIRELKKSMVALATPRAKAQFLFDNVQSLFKVDETDKAGGSLVRPAEPDPLQDFLISQMKVLPLSLDEKLQILLRITDLSTNNQTDLFLEALVLDDLKNKKLSSTTLDLIEKILKERRVSSQSLHIQLAEVLLEIDFKKLDEVVKTSNLSERNTVLLVDRIEALIPFTSTKKDKLLEDLAWRSHSAEPSILNFVQSVKGVSFNKAHPVLVNLGSVLSELSRSMTYDQNFELIKFFVSPKKTKLPSFVMKNLKRNPSFANWSESRILRELNDLTPMEYIPAFEFLLMQPQFSILTHPKLTEKILVRLCKMDPKSKDYLWFNAYVSSVRPHLRAGHIAYQLSQSMDSSGTVEKTKFEIFGSMGIVTAQMGETLGWLTSISSDLKDDATPPPKSMIMAQLKKHLSAAEFVKIRRPVRILGSASVSTAIEFELNDGRRVVILTQRPNAREQVKGNADGMRLFVEKMSKADPSFPRTAALMFIQVAESQILEELNYLNTVKKIAAAREFYGRMNRTMRKTLGDFRFYVPDIVAGFEPRPEVLVIEKIEGETFDKLPVGSAREQVGRSIVVSGLESFFLENWFNEDQHERQFKIDLNHRVPIDGGAFYPINVFDFGKSSFAVRLSPWKSDTQYRFAQLFRALEAGNLNASIDEAFKMSMTEDARVHPDMKLIKSNVMKLAAPAFTSDKSVMDRILALREAFETEQLIFPDSFYLGRLKGMMMLSREEFVPEKEFDKLIHGYVVRALVNKSPLLVGEMAKNMVNGTCDYMLQKIPGS